VPGTARPGDLAVAGRLRVADRTDPHRHTISASIGPWILALISIFQPQEAAEAEQLLNELNGGKPTPYELAGMARLWVRAGLSGMPRAQDLQRQAIALTPEVDVRVREGLNYDLAGMLIVTGDMQGAAAAYEEVLRLAPTNVNAINNLAFLKADSLDKPAEAIPLAERLLELAADQAPMLDTVGWVYYRAGDLGKAQQHLTRSIAILPSFDAYLHLAEVLFKQGDAGGAEKQLAEAEKLSPDSEGLQKIKTLRDDIGRTGAPGG
jgi:tetratricopeptide (TPR) repeat protein